MRKIYLLEYTGRIFERSFNLGDDIQTLAVSRLVPHVDGYVSREYLNEVKEPCTVPMNGFFMNSENWPPSPFVRPVFFSFHVTPQSQRVICSPSGIDYLKKWQPIGCRDRGTLKALQDKGVEAYYSRCLTLTLPRREKDPPSGQVFIVGVGDAALSAIPKSIRREAIRVDQAKVRLPITDTKIKLMLAEELLRQYRERARLVITSKIHCAMPCIAMGIPVVFLYGDHKKDDYRVKVVKDLIGINYVRQEGALAAIVNAGKQREIDWSPSVPDIEDTKKEIVDRFLLEFSRVHEE